MERPERLVRGLVDDGLLVVRGDRQAYLVPGDGAGMDGAGGPVAERKGAGPGRRPDGAVPGLARLQGEKGRNQA